MRPDPPAPAAKKAPVSHVSNLPGASANAQTVYNALRARGYSTAAAAGAIGNLQQESSVNPGSVQQGGAGRGIAQWGVGARWSTENAYAAQHKEDPWALNTQVGFLVQEMGQYGLTPSSAFGRSTNVAAATQTFESVYEKAGTPNMAGRDAYAANAYAAFSGNAITAGGASVPAKPPVGSTSGGISPLQHLLNVPGDVGGALQTGAQDLTGAASGAASAVTSVPEAVAKVTTTLFNVSFWIRVTFIIVGAALVFIGTKSLLSGEPPTMPTLPGTTPPPKASPSKSSKPFGKGIEADFGDVAA